MKKLLIGVFALFMIIGFTSIGMGFELHERPLNHNYCNSCPTTVINTGGSFQSQGWGHGDFYSNYGNIWAGGHYQAGGTASFIRVVPGNTNGITVNGNSYAQGFTSGEGKVSSFAGANEHNNNTEGRYWETENTRKFNVGIHGHSNFVCNNHIGGHIKYVNNHHDISGYYKTHDSGYDFTTFAGGSLEGPGTYQGQSGFNYTRVRWNNR